MYKEGVASFNSEKVKGEVLFQKVGKLKTKIHAFFTKLPPGLHGFHIHRAGDLRGEGCVGACEHYHRGPPQSHGGPPSTSKKGEQRHTGDLGNIEEGKKYTFYINASLFDLFGRSIIVHADPDDLGKGDYEDSPITGHSGARIGCAIIGRSSLSKCQPRFTSPHRFTQRKCQKSHCNKTLKKKK